jgi:hypothetical protein
MLSKISDMGESFGRRGMFYRDRMGWYGLFWLRIGSSDELL